jgi:hypothetical protein
LFNCTIGICEDVDGDWRNGCEVARNNDRDSIGVFMNINQDMDCSVLSEEAERNPELFRHHLHIDLSKSIQVTTDATPLLPGSIFCNNGAITTPNSNGKCYFACVTGYRNSDGRSYNGCEDVDSVTPASYPHVGTLGEPFGGYWIGDPEAEAYIDFLCDIDQGVILDANNQPIRLNAPRNVCLSAQRISGGFPTLGPILWY